MLLRMTENGRLFLCCLCWVLCVTTVHGCIAMRLHRRRHRFANTPINLPTGDCDTNRSLRFHEYVPPSESLKRFSAIRKGCGRFSAKKREILVCFWTEKLLEIFGDLFMSHSPPTGRLSVFANISLYGAIRFFTEQVEILSGSIRDAYAFVDPIFMQHFSDLLRLLLAEEVSSLTIGCLFFFTAGESH
jgi:hypothetical protein